MTEPSERLEHRLLLRLLKEPVPLDLLHNALQVKAVAELRALGLVRNASRRRQLALTVKGERMAKQIAARRSQLKR